jgi:hypothetical protein
MTITPLTLDILIVVGPSDDVDNGLQVVILLDHSREGCYPPKNEARIKNF